MQRDHDETPIFESEDAATAALEDPDLSRSDRMAAEVALIGFRGGYDAATLNEYDTISTGQADDLKLETGQGYRFWLSRCGVEDGEPFEHTVTVEYEENGRWVNVCRYDGGEIEPTECEECGEELIGESCENCGWSPNEEDRGKFVLEIHPGNAAMLRGRDVASALRDVSGKLDGEYATGWEGEGNIRDGNGNTVGRWTFHDHN